MSKEVVKAIFDENIAGVREDLTFDAYFDSIKGNEEYKKGLFENYVNDGTKSYEEFNAETFGVGKPEAPSEVGGAESSPTGLGLSESEVGPPAGGTPPGAEPVGAPVSDAIEPIEPGEPEAPAITVGLEDFEVVDNKKRRGFFETIASWFGGDKSAELIEKPFEELVPARQRLFKKAAAKDLSKEIGSVFTEAESDENITELGAKGFLSTNNLAGYLAGDFKEDNVAREEINKFLEEGVSGQTEAFKRFEQNLKPIIEEQSNEVRSIMLNDRAYINLNKEIDREFASQRAEIDARYSGVISSEKQAKLDEATVGLRAEYDAAMLSLPTENDVLAKKNEMLTRYQMLVNDGKMDVDTANAELQKEYGAYESDITAKANEAVNAYNSGLEKAAEKIKSGLKDTEEYKQYISELTELRNSIITSREGDLKAIQSRIQGDLAPKYNERINSVIRASSSGPTPLLEKSGLLPTIQKVINNKGFDLLPFDQKKAFLDRAFGNVVVQLRSKGVAINDGTIARLRNEYDDAIMSKAYFTQKGAPSLYMLKTRAIEEAEKLDEVIASTKAKTGTKTFTSGVYASEFGQQGKGYDDRELDQLLLAREKLQEIIDLPENMTDNEFANFWNGLTSGQFVDYLPFVSGLKNLAGSLTLYRSLEDDTPASRYLQNAVALGNSYKGVYEANNMASDWYKAGAATAESLPFMGEFVFTAGIGSVARKSAEKFVTRLLGKAAEKTVAAKSLRVFAGTLVGSLAQTTANPQRYIDETIKRMTPQMSIAFSEDGDDLVAMLDESTAEGGFEAFLKGYGVTASEYFSENLGFAGARALKYAGSRMMQNEFLKRAYIGWYMSKFNIDMPTAFKRLAEKGGWNGFFAEFGEELANMPLTNLITGDADVMAGIFKESGDLDIENLMEVGRALVPISAVGVGANVLGIAVKSMTPENVTISYRDINNLPATETIDRGVWEKVTEALKSPDKLREFISNELPRLKVEGKAREIITRELESGLSRFEGGVVESTMPPQAKGAAETQPAPKVSVQMKERKKLSADKKRLVGTGKFDFVVTIDGKEQNISRAEYNEYKRSGKLPEGIGADVLGEVDRVEGVVVESTKDAESIKTSLEGVEVPAELGTIENVAEVYEQAKGKEELTDAEVAVVDFVEGNVAKVEGVSEGVVEATPKVAEAETAVSPLQDVESTTKALEGVEQENPKLANAVYEAARFSNDLPLPINKEIEFLLHTEKLKINLQDITLEEEGNVDLNSKDKWNTFAITAKGKKLGYIQVKYKDDNTVKIGLSALYEGKEEVKQSIISKILDLINNLFKTKKVEISDKKINVNAGKGVGKIAYELLAVKLKREYQKDLVSDTTRSDYAENLWKSFEKQGKASVIGKTDTQYRWDYYYKFNVDNQITPQQAAEAYHKAKADNSNPELVKAVEDLLGVTPEAVTPEVSGVAEVAEGQKKPSRVATFFSGAGTMEASLPNAQSVMAVEFNPAYVEAYNKAFGVEYKPKDVRDINPDEVIASKPDIFHASPVCKNFSAAKNKRTVLKSDMESADAVARVIREAQPPIVTIENVPDYQGTVPFETIIKALEDAGYTFDVGVYNSADFGGVQNRERLLIRAVKSGELPPIQEKTAPGDWYSAIEDLIESAPDSKFESRSESENWEMARIKDMIRKGKLDPSKPIITMGGSASRGLAAAANAGGPAPTLLSTSRSVPRIILPDGTVKRVTPEMMRRLMGLPESYPIPSNPRIAKEVLGNGVDGAFTRALIDPLLNRAETQPSAETPAKPLTLKEKAKEAEQRAQEDAEKIKKLFRGRNGGLGISPFSRAKRLAEIDKAILTALASYVRNKVLAGAYTFQDFVKDMKENSKRMFGVEIKLTSQDELFFNQAASMYEIDDAFAGEIMELKNDFIFAIPSAPKNAGFKEFVAANQSIVDQFVASAERNYGLNATQANALVESMYQDAVAAAAEQPQTYETEADIKDYHQNNIASTQKLNAIYNESRAQEIKRRSNLISRLWTSFVKSFISPTVVFNRVFKIGSKRLSLEREVYASRKSRLGASSKAANWYNDMHKKIFGGLSWGELNLLNKYLVYRRIAEVEEMRQKKNIEAKRLREELADPATTDDRKAEINEELAKLGNLDEVKHGSIIVNGKREAILASDARGFVAEINAGTDALSIKIKERAEMYTKANNELLKMRLDAGLISQEAYDSMEKRDYVRRIFLDLSASTIDAVDYPSISDKIKAIQAGSEEKVLEMDTQTLLQLNAAATFDAVAKNNFINKVAKWTESNQQAFLDKALEKFKNKFEKKNGRQPTDDEIQKFLKEQTLFELIRNNQTPKSGFEKVTYFVDGVEKSIAVRSDLANVFRTASGREVAPPWVRNLAKILSYVGLNNLVKLTAVFVNPAFALGNFALDVIHASMVTRDLYKSFSFNLGVILAKALGITAENVYSKAVNYGGSLFGIAKRDSKFDRLVKDYFAHGGGMTFMSSSKARMYTDRLSSSRANQALSDFADGLNSVFSALNSIQSGSELITRVIIYEAALEKNIKEYKKQNGIEPTGADLTSIKESAAASAADLIDFREGSNFTKILDQSLFPFLNAMAQGAKAEIEFIRDNPLEAALRVSEFGGMALAVALYNAKSGDDDEKNGIIGYNGVSDYMRSNYFIMMMPYTKQNEKGETVRPFLSFKLPAFLKGVNIFVNGVVSGKSSGQTASMALEAIKGGYVPEIGAASPMTQAVFALKANKDFFRDGQKIYRGREDVLLTDRFNAGETKKVYRDLFDMFYNFSNEDNEDKGLLFFDDAGPAQWQAAVEKAISPNNSYYLFLTASYANLTGLFGEKNSREVDAVYDNMFSALNSLTMRVYRTPQSSVQNKNIKDKEKLEFLERQIGSWRKKNDDLITSIVSKKLREIDANPNAGARETQILDFFTDGIFEFISDKEIERGIKAQGIKEAPDNYNKMIDFVKEEQSRMANKLYEEFKPGAISAFPSLKNYRDIKRTILELEKRTDAINKIRDEYLSLETEKRVDFLVALTFVAGNEFKKIVEIIGADEEEAYDMYTEILNGAEAEEYKIPFLRNEDYSGRISSESALDKMILLQRLMRNE